jgi:hypothetical protein
MNKKPATAINFTIPGLAMLTVSGLVVGLTMSNLTGGNAIQRGLAKEIAATDAALKTGEINCMASHAARTIQNGSMLRPGPAPDATALRVEAISSAQEVCLG